MSWTVLHVTPPPALIRALDDAGTSRASLIDLGIESLEVRFTVPAARAAEAHPTFDGGLFVIDDDGTLFRYDASGELVDEFDTDATGIGFMTVDPATGKIAVAAVSGDVTIIDPATGTSESLPTLEPIANLGFGRDGELLVLTGVDGTVRLWDLERGASAGVAWKGSGAVFGSPSWFDPSTSSIWVSTSGTILNIPLDPGQWIERACDVVGRDLTQDEWDRLVPGDEPRQSACGRTIVDEPTGEAAEALFELVTAFVSEDGVGTFEVPLGAADLGCSNGSVVENGGPGGITNRFTCEGGPREGTFAVQWQISEDVPGPGDVNGLWEVTEATGDFVGLTGGGVWSGTADASGAFGSFPGDIRYDS